MKPILLLPPVAALAVTGVWLGTQQRSITALEKETLLLRQHVNAARQTGDADGDPSFAARAGGAKDKDPDTIDWKGLADSMASAQRGGIPDMRAMMKLQTKLMALSEAELAAALDEIAALELSQEARRNLENMVIGMLIQKDPQLVLDRYLDKLGDPRSGIGWQLAHGFQQWVAKDGAVALAWLDTQIAAGKFDSKSLDGKSHGRLQFEAAAIVSLIATDPDAAGRRIVALPEDQRRELFQQGGMTNLRPGSEKAYAALIREHVPENERGQALASSTHFMIHQGGYEKVGAYLDEIEATPAERTEVAKQAARNKFQNLSHEGKIDRQAVDEMRGWVAGQSPDEVDRITGEALSNLWGERAKWTDNAKLIDELHTENPSDDLLVSFLGGHQAMQHREAALELAAKIADETKRAEVTARLEGKAVRSSATIIAD